MTVFGRYVLAIGRFCVQEIIALNTWLYFVLVLPVQKWPVTNKCRPICRLDSWGRAHRAGVVLEQQRDHRRRLWTDNFPIKCVLHAQKRPVKSHVVHCKIEEAINSLPRRLRPPTALQTTGGEAKKAISTVETQRKAGREELLCSHRCCRSSTDRQPRRADRAQAAAHRPPPIRAGPAREHTAAAPKRWHVGRLDRVASSL